MAASSVVEDFTLICLASPSPEGCSSPTAPKITLARDRFMPLHMMFVRINPEAPTKAPEIIRPLFIRTNPVAAAATPE